MAKASFFYIIKVVLLSALAFSFSACKKEKINTQRQKYLGNFTFTYTKSHTTPQWQVVVDTVITYDGYVISDFSSGSDKVYIEIHYLPDQIKKTEVKPDNSFPGITSLSTNSEGGYADDYNELHWYYSHPFENESVRGVRR